MQAKMATILTKMVGENKLQLKNNKILKLKKLKMQRKENLCNKKLMKFWLI